MLADVDLENAPMLAALERIGMERRAELRVYWARLRPVSN
jgi:RimJ/RimL family protein N-acetyltransferase